MTNASAPSSQHLIRKTLAASVADSIRERIIKNEIKAGEALRQDALANLLNVSRIPVREALLQLEAEGLVTFVPHKGAVASKLSLEDVEELFSLRALLECDIIGTAIANASPEDFEKAEQILENFDALLEPGADIKELGALNWAFHQSLYTPSRRTRMLAIISGLHAHCDRHLRLQIELSSDHQRAKTEHHELLTLCKEGKKTAAKKLLHSHIKTTGKKLVRAILSMR
ncbi:MAG: DNA-binding GntR family transcriptional regulator [Candidatus Azotimanducaceae bacterium]